MTLRTSASASSGFLSPIESTRAHVELGLALEAKGDTAGACAAYAAVLLRWHQPKPRSITWEKAEARTRTLRCPRDN